MTTERRIVNHAAAASQLVPVATPPGLCIPFSYAGALVAGVVGYGDIIVGLSPPYSPPTGTAITEILCNLGTAGSTITQVGVAVNGVLLEPLVVIGAYQRQSDTTTPQAGSPVGYVFGLFLDNGVQARDQLSVMIYGAGTGAQDLDVQIYIGSPLPPAALHGA